MPSEDVEVLRGLYAEWEKGNMWALREVAAPEIEWEWSPGMASLSGGPRVYRGLEEIEQATREWLAAWGSYWMTAEEFIEAPLGIVIPMQSHARTTDAEMVIEQQLVGVWTMRGGKIVRVRFYEDRDEALRAAGA